MSSVIDPRPERRRESPSGENLMPRSTDYEYNLTSSFTLNANNAAFQAGVNTITFRVANENGPTPANPSGLFIQSLHGTVSAPQNLITVGYCPTLSTLSLGSPPAVNPTNPADGATYPFTAGSSVSVPAGFTATSPRRQRQHHGDRRHAQRRSGRPDHEQRRRILRDRDGRGDPFVLPGGKLLPGLQRHQCLRLGQRHGFLHGGPGPAPDAHDHRSGGRRDRHPSGRQQLGRGALHPDRRHDVRDHPVGRGHAERRRGLPGPHHLRPQHDGHLRQRFAHAHRRHLYPGRDRFQRHRDRLRSEHLHGRRRPRQWRRFGQWRILGKRVPPLAAAEQLQRPVRLFQQRLQPERHRRGGRPGRLRPLFRQQPQPRTTGTAGATAGAITATSSPTRRP